VTPTQEVDLLLRELNW